MPAFKMKKSAVKMAWVGNGIIVLFLFVLAIGLTVTDQIDLIDKESKWQTNVDDIEYFYTCIDSHKMIAVQGDHGYTIQLSGPIGTCQD